MKRVRNEESKSICEEMGKLKEWVEGSEVRKREEKRQEESINEIKLERNVGVLSISIKKEQSGQKDEGE